MVLVVDLPVEILRHIADFVCALTQSQNTAARPNATMSLVATCTLFHKVAAERQAAFLMAVASTQFQCLSAMQLSRVEGARICRALSHWHRHRATSQAERSCVNILGWSHEARQQVDPASAHVLLRVRTGDSVVASALLPWQPQTVEYRGVNAATGVPDREESKAYTLDPVEFVPREASIRTEQIFPDAAGLSPGCDVNFDERARAYMHAAGKGVEAQLVGLTDLEVDAVVLSWQPGSAGSAHRELRWAPLVTSFPARALDVQFDSLGDEHYTIAPHEPNYSLEGGAGRTRSNRALALCWPLRLLMQFRKLDEHGQWTGDQELHPYEPLDEFEEFSGTAEDGANYGYRSFLGDNWLELNLSLRTALRPLQPTGGQAHEQAQEQAHALETAGVVFVYQMEEPARGVHPLNLLLNRLDWHGLATDAESDAESEASGSHDGGSASDNLEASTAAALPAPHT